MYADRADKRKPFTSEVPLVRSGRAKKLVIANMNCCDRKTEMKTLHLILRDGSDRTISHVVPVKMSPLTTS